MTGSGDPARIGPVSCQGAPMRMTVDLDDELVKRAAESSGIHGLKDLFEEGLRQLIGRAALQKEHEKS